MKTYRYRLVDTGKRTPGRVISRSNNPTYIFRRWKKENFSRDGRRYLESRSEIETYCGNEEWARLEDEMLPL